MNSDKNTRACLLGSEAAGKTCFIGGLGLLAAPDRKSDFDVRGQNKDSQAYLNDLVDSLQRQTWPASTTQLRELRFDVRFQALMFDITLLDFQGEEFRRAFHERDRERLEVLWKHLDDVDVLLLMLDPDVDLEESPDATHPELQRRRERLDAILQAVIDRCVERVKSGGRTAAPNLAVLLSKCDRKPELRDEKSAERFLSERAPQLYERLKTWAPQLRVFPVSAVGGIEQHIENGEATEQARIVPPKNPQPFGYERIFTWISDCKLAPERRRRNVRLGMALLLIALPFIAWFAQVRWRMHQLRPGLPPTEIAAIDRDVLWPAAGYQRHLDGIVEPALAALRKRLDDAPGMNEQLEIIAAAEALAECRHSKHQEEASRLHADASRLRRQTMFNQAKEAFDHRQADFEVAAETFLRTYPQGEDAIQVRDLQRTHAQDARAREREVVRKIPADESRFLAKKADAIATYLVRYEKEDPNAVEMRRAEKLARRLSTGATYTVRLRSCGIFATPRDHSVKIFHKGVALREPFDSNGDTSSSRWEGDDARFQIHWEPGDELKTELWDHDLRDELAATESEKSPLSLHLLSGRRSLAFGPGWNSTYFREGPYVEFELEGFADDDWRVLGDWIYPGEKW